DQVKELALLAESYGLRALWAQNYVSARDPFMCLVPAAQETTRIKLGVVVISPYEMHPMKTGNALLTLNEFCQGRAEVVIGGGGFWCSRMGTQAHRMVRAIREAIEIIKGGLQDDPLQYEGQLYKAYSYNSDWSTDPVPRVYAGASREQMLRMGARVADGVMTSDVIRPLIDAAVKTVGTALDEFGRSKSDFHFNSAIAFHMKADREASMREARRELITRAVLSEWYLHSFMSEDEVAIVRDNISSFYKAYRAKTHIIDGVPDAILSKLVDNFSIAGGPEDLDARIIELQDYVTTGITELCFRVHDDPAFAIRYIGENIAPALK
ncbi:MAG: LLM class flavin-dependent oxidoreductase, partial [Gammaproteobacteria bacterium]|nr:LLM class flavin-dependent oxidoreductase [Gammaproteobacteria bacterium]